MVGWLDGWLVGWLDGGELIIVLKLLAGIELGNYFHSDICEDVEEAEDADSEW